MTSRIWHSAAGLGEFACRKTLEFTGGEGAGQAGSTCALFTVTGAVATLVIAACTKTLVGATATVEVGTNANPNAIIATTGAPTITTGTIWVDATPVVIECWTNAWGCMIGDGADIELLPGVANVTDGTLVFTCFWTPLTDGATVVAA